MNPEWEPHAMPTEESATPDAGTATDNPDPDQQTPKPTETVDHWRAMARKHEGRAKENAAAAKELADIKAANATDLERAVHAARDETRTEMLAAVNGRLLAAEARSAAAEARFKNPSLAIKAIDLTAIEVDADGNVDQSALKAALAELAAAEPYLVDDGRPARPAPDMAQGQQAGKPDEKTKGLEMARKMFGDQAATPA
jgi:hypothetical protein